MEMHAIQSKQASMSSGCIVAHPDITPVFGVTDGWAVICSQTAATSRRSLILFSVTPSKPDKLCNHAVLRSIAVGPG
jgi:hypothetical protein